MAVHPIGEGRQAVIKGGRLLHWIVLDAVPTWEEATRKAMCKNKADCNLVYGPQTVNIRSFLTSSATPTVGLSRRRKFRSEPHGMR